MARWLIVLLIFAVTSGCASAWEEHFRVAPGFRSSALSARDDASIVEVEWERLAAYEQAARSRAIARDTLIVDPNSPAAVDERARFLRAVRVGADPRSVMVIGSSRFIRSVWLDLYDDEIAAFSARAGGDIAVVSVEPLGLRDTVEYATRTEFFERDIYDRSGKRRSGRVERRVDERVPVVVPRESWGYTLIVLRVVDL